MSPFTSGRQLLDTMESLPDDFRRLSVGALNKLLSYDLLDSAEAPKRAPFFPLKFGPKKLESSLKETTKKIIELMNQKEEHSKHLDAWIRGNRLIVEKLRLMYEKEIETSEGMPSTAFILGAHTHSDQRLRGSSRWSLRRSLHAMRK